MLAKQSPSFLTGRTLAIKHSAVNIRPLSITSYQPKTFNIPRKVPTQAQLFSSLVPKKNINEVVKKSFNAAPKTIVTFEPTIFNSNYNYAALFKNTLQKRERTGYSSVTIERDTSRFMYFIAALVALALGSLMAYAFSNESSAENVVTQRLRHTLLYVAAGLGFTAASAKYFFNSQIFWRMAAMNPWASLALTLGGTLVTMILTQSIPYEATIPKHLSFLAFNSMVGLSLCPIVSLGGPLLLKAAFATGCVVSALSLTAASAPEGTFLAWGGPLSIGLGTVFAASLGSVFFPGSSLLYNIALYGGAGVFGFFVLHDVDRMQVQAKYAPHYDPINSSIGLYLDIVNLFIRIATIMSNGNSRK